jgi:ABC-type uncharacterized transport system auxiliary subunit
MKKYILALALPLAGCISVFPEPEKPAKKVSLSLCHFQKQKHVSRPQVLIVDRPQAQSELATKNIRIIRPGSCVSIVDTIADYEWEEKLPDLIESAIVQAIESSHIFKGVAKSSEWVKGDLTLLTEIRHFDVVIADTPHVEVELAVKVMTSTEHKLITQHTFKQKQALECITLPSILDTYSCVVDRLLIDVTKWLARIPHKSSCQE